MFALGAILWIFVTALSIEHYPFSAAMGLLHAALASMVTASAFMPRTMLHWP
jgi:hypothetical protein